jgi:hypothetical protein
VCVRVRIYMSIDHFSFDTEQPFRSWNEMFSAVSTLQRPYYCNVLCVYVLQAVLGGSNHIHIFICQCYGSLTEVQQFEDPSLITLKFCEMLLYIR